MSGRIKYKYCPLCLSKDFISLTSGISTHVGRYEMNWKKCGYCSHIFTAGFFTDAELAKILSTVQDIQTVGHDTEGQRFVSAKMIDKVLPYKDKGRWLDVGFGNGSLLMTAKEYGFEPVGLDLRRNSVDLLNSSGIKAYALDISSFVTHTPFDVISMCDVLEHIPYPNLALRRAQELMNKDGVLLLSMPNTESIVWDLLGSHNPYWSEVEHYHNFSRTNLYTLLKNTGFTPVKFGISERYRLCMEVIAKRI